MLFDAAQYAPDARKLRRDFVKKALLFGYGYVARRLAPLLIAQGWAVSGAIRAAAKSDALVADGVTPVMWIDGAISSDAFDDAAALLVSTPPGTNGCPAFAAARDRIAARAAAIGWIGYLSTNGVYGDHGGAVVTEASPLRAASERALNRLKAEDQWAAFARSIGVPLVIFRLPGIYGPGRSTFDAIREGRAQRIDKPGQMFSRAHVDDIAAAVCASLADPRAGSLFNIADDEPSPPQDVVAYACALAGVAPPPLVPFDEANLSDMARSFYADNKRVSNTLMKERLLPELAYPSYREGLRAIFEEERAEFTR